MSAWRRLLVLLVALALVPAASRADGPAPELPDDVFTHVPGMDTVDVVLFGADRAVVVRVHVKVGPKTFRTSWDDFIARLYAYLDRDDDRVLTTAEATRAPWTNILSDPFNGIQAPRLGSRPVSLDAEPRDGKVSFDELANYLQGTQDFTPLRSESGAPPHPCAQALFNQLDRDGDKVITRAELAETDALVVKLDRDEDETLSADELTPDRSPFADRFGRVNQSGNPIDPAKGLGIPLTSADIRMGVTNRLLSVYGKQTAGKIGPEPLGADPAAFKAADRDGDGRLNRDEVSDYLQSPTAHLELNVTLPATRPGRGRIENASVPPKASALRTRTGANGSFVVEFEGSEIEFLASDTQNNRGRVFENQFKMADADKNGAISAQEARGNFLLQRLHLVADRNGDGKMTESELRAYLDLSNAAEEARISFTVSDQGIALHERLDADNDGRLSVRELRGARAKLAPFDADRNGRVSLAELPRRVQVNLGRGPVVNRRAFAVAAINMSSSRRATADRQTLPAWFVGMDRNHDGDVSPREFLGTSDQFRRFDADGDGLVDGVEAARNP